MKNSCKITKRYVESLKPVQGQEVLYWDSELKGFGVRIFPTGRCTYFVQYRNEFSRTRRKKIGVHGSITTEQAREEAKQLMGLIASGEDPSEIRKESRKKTRFDELAHQYLEHYAKGSKRPKSYSEDQRMLSQVLLPKLGARKIEEITTRDVQLIHNELRSKPYMANRTRSLLSKIFNLAKQWKWIDLNPVEGVNKYQEHKRDRWLDTDELGRLWNVLEKYSHHPTSYLFKLLLLTGARKGEMMNARWEQFDLEKGLWEKPSHLTKQKKKEHLPLSEKALSALQAVRKLNLKDSQFVFPGRVEGQPIKEIKTFWKKVLKESNLENVRIHDLRHTHASHLVSSGLSLSIVGKLLGHTEASTTQRYAHLADESLREAAELFGSKVG